jgi:hypothetical protein
MSDTQAKNAQRNTSETWFTTGYTLLRDLETVLQPGKRKGGGIDGY